MNKTFDFLVLYSISKVANNRFGIRLRAICLLFLIIAGFDVAGQTVNGSIYSNFGIGNLQPRSSAYSRALGYTGIGVRDAYNINVSNPAAYNSLGKPFTTSFEIGGNYETVLHRTDVSSSVSKAGGLNGINLLFMVKPKWGFAVGASPFSNVSYKTSTTRFISAVNYSAREVLEGTGGVNQFYLGSSYEIFKNFSLGGNVAYYIGTVQHIETLDATPVSIPMTFLDKATASKLSGDLGAQYTANIKKTKITVGATWNPGVNLSGTRQQTLLTSNLDTLKKTDKKNLTYRLPASYGTGISVSTPRSLFAFDASWKEWKSAKMNDQEVYQNTFRYSFGYEHRGNQSTQKYINIIALRAGLFTEDYPVLVKNIPIRTWGYTVGLSLPLNHFTSSVNINYSYTQLGTTDNGLVREQASKISLDFILRDIWGIRRKFD